MSEDLKGWMTLEQIQKQMKKVYGQDVGKSELDMMILKGVVKTIKIKGVDYYKVVE